MRGRAAARVIDYGRTLPVSHRQNGDTIAMKVGMDARGNPRRRRMIRL